MEKEIRAYGNKKFIFSGGKGIAAALMAEARKQAQHAGAVSLELCVWNFNESALRLYEKLGMKVQFLRMEDDLKNG